MSRPWLLDLFCGAGGAAVGYQRAGFDVVGVDIAPQPNYPFGFVRADALDYAADVLGFGHYAAVHASPPCQAHSTIGKQVRATGQRLAAYPDLVAPTRALLQRTGLPYVIENVVGAPLHGAVMLCGSSFALNLRRHRLFETNWPVMAAPCAHGWQARRFRSLDKRRNVVSPVVTVAGTGAHNSAAVVGVHSHINYVGERELREWAMGIDWMSPYELTQAIPPAYTEFVGEQLMAHLRAKAAA